jgi:hypothetical protein
MRKAHEDRLKNFRVSEHLKAGMRVRTETSTSTPAGLPDKIVGTQKIAEAPALQLLN